jgi:hypothetical protein
MSDDIVTQSAGDPAKVEPSQPVEEDQGTVIPVIVSEDKPEEKVVPELKTELKKVTTIFFCSFKICS